MRYRLNFHSRRPGLPANCPSGMIWEQFNRFATPSRDAGIWLNLCNTRHIRALGQFMERSMDMRDAAREDMEAFENPFHNGKKGEAYQCSFRLPSCVKNFKFCNLEQLGFKLHVDSLDPLQCAVTGVPPQAGEFEIVLLFIWPGWLKGMKHLSRKFKLRINADPRELWKDIPTDGNLEYWKEDRDGAVIEGDGCRLVAASIRGRSHAHVGSPRDDDFALARDTQTGWQGLIVADGAGSAKFSRKGSAIAAQTAMITCLRQLSNMHELDRIFGELAEPSLSPALQAEAKKLAYMALPQGVFDAYKAIREEAGNMGRDIKDYATTLLVAAAKKYPIGWVVLTFQIGDGAMGLLSSSDGKFEAKLLAEPDEGEYGGQTRFITMKDMFESQNLINRLHIDIARNLEALILMTDGVSDAKFATLANLRNPAYWRSLWLETKELATSREPVEALSKWLEFWSQGNHDDRTIAMLLSSHSSVCRSNCKPV